MILFLISIVILLGYGLLVFGRPVYEVGGVVFYSKKQAEKYAELLKNIIKQEQELEELKRFLRLVHEFGI